MQLAALYIRVSTEDQAQEGYSLEVQREYLEAFARREGCQIYRVYRDEGVSAYSTNRPELQELLKDAKNKKFNVVFVYKIDRFSRRLKDLLNLVEELEFYGVGFKSATEPFDTTTSAGKLMFQQLGSFAEFERNRIKERIFPGMVRSVKEGKWQGARYAPYGYRYNKEKKMLEVVEKEALIVQKIYSMYLSGYSTSQITAYLYQRGYKSRTGRRFHSKLVCDILKNKVYIGKIVWNRRHYDINKKTKEGLGKGNRYLPNKNTEVIEVQGKHQAIISEEDFYKVQRKLSYHKRGTRVFNKYSHFLTGILKCGICGTNYMGYTNISSHRTGVRKKWYRCRLKQETRGIECNNSNVVAEPLEEFAFNILEKIVSNPAIKEQRFKQLVKVMVEPDDDIIAEINSLKEKLKLNLDKQNKLAEMYLNSMIGREVYEKRQDPLRDEEVRIRERIENLEMGLVEKERSKEYHVFLHSILANFSETKKCLTVAEKKSLLRLIFKKIVIKYGEIIEYELYEPFNSLLKNGDVRECDKKWQVIVNQTVTKKDPSVCIYARSVVK